MSTGFQLTPHQIEFMDTFGYLSLPGLLKDKIEEIDAAFEVLLLGRGSDNHDGQQRFCVCPCINHSEYLCTLLDDERITGLAAGLLGESFQYWNSDGNYYSGDTPWHSDTAWPEPLRFYKMAIYLDRMTRDTGALRVIPGSHRHGEGFADHLQDLLKSRDGPWLGLRGDEIPAVALETDPGDLVVFNHSTKHSAWGGGEKRRMLTIVFTGQQSGESVSHFKDVVEQHGYTRREVFGVPDGPILTTAPPERLRHLQQLLEHVPDAP